MLNLDSIPDNNLTMAKFQPPSELDFTKSSTWPEWKQRFLRYRTVSKLANEDGEIQVSTLIYSMGQQAETIFNSLRFSNVAETAAAERKNFDTVLEKFDAYFMPKRNIIHERALFHQRNQRQGESAESFIRALYLMAETCVFGALRDECIRDRIVVGIRDKDLSNQLQMLPDLTLDLAVQKVRQSELVKLQNQPETSVDAVKRQPKTRQPTKVQGATSSPQASRQRMPSSAHERQTNQRSSCSRCGYRHGDKCPAMDGVCRKCGKKGHFARRCRTKQLSEVAETQEFFIGAIDVVDCDDEVEPPWLVDLQVSDSTVTFKVDSGADTSVMNEDSYTKLRSKPPLFKTSATLHSLKSKLDVTGKFKAEVPLDGQVYTFDVYVVKGSCSNLLSRSASKQMGFVRSTIAEVSSKPIGLWDTEPVTITLKENTTPYHVNTARRVPLPLKPKVDAELKRMEDAGVIEKVTEPTDWCAPIVATLKKSGDVRICVDLRQLNKAVKRERYVLPTLDDIAGKMAGATVFSALDITSGYHHVPLSPASRKMTTFITPNGRYCFKRLPFGITSASEIFQRKISDLLDDIPGVETSQDDILIFGCDTPEHDKRLKEVEERAKKAGIQFNRDKCQIRKSCIAFLGEKFDKTGMRPDPEKVRAICDLAPPTDVSELRRLMGMVNYLGRYLENLSTVCKPMTDLLKDDISWQWGPPQAAAFAKVKELLATAPTLAYYDASKPTVVSADASSYGLGGVLWQQDGDTVRPVAYASRTLTDTERRYAQIEKELLAAVWACEKFHRYIYGLDTHLRTDHKPLVPLINGTDLDKAPLRCQRLLMRLMRYNVAAEHVPGKDLVVADALSRSPCSQEDSYTEEEVQLHVDALKAEWPASDAKLSELRSQTCCDPVLQQAIRFTLDGWPSRINEVNPVVREFHNVRAHLSVADGLLLYDNRIVIPAVSQEDVLKRIHEGHQGITKCRERAATGVWWPGLTKAITGIVNRCDFCQKHRTAQRKEPLVMTPLPDGPWQHIAMDICDHNGDKYLVVVDFYSRYIEIANLRHDTTTDKVITALGNMFARWGDPIQVTSDNGPQFASDKFRQYAAKRGFTHTTSSPHYHQGNGEAERAVQTVRKFLHQEDPVEALAIYRATPIHSTGHSPAELMIGRQPRTRLPMIHRNMEAKVPDQQEIIHRDDAYKKSVAQNYNERHGTRPLSTLLPGDQVRIKTDEQREWSSPAKVVQRDERSYTVETPAGSRLRRNRRHVQQCPETPQVATQGDTVHDTPVDNHVVPSEPRRSERTRKPVCRLDL